MKSTTKGFARISAFVFAVMVAAAAQAQTTGKATIATEATPQVQYIGTIDYKPVFKIAFDNTAAENVIITLKDTDGYVLYNERFRNTKFSKKFQFDESDFKETRLTLTVSSTSGSSTQQLQFSGNVRTVEDVAFKNITEE